MSANTKIEWATHTFNPVEGCQKVGPGCENCYAESRNARFGGGVATNWGPDAPRRRTSAENWRKPLAWNANHAAFFTEHGYRQRVFCASLADVFDNQWDPQWRADLFALIAATPNLDWLLLTKRIGNVLNLMRDAVELVVKQPKSDGLIDVSLARFLASWLAGDAPNNVWLGATVVNQEEADRDIPKLLAMPAAKRFLSMEPMLGPVDLTTIDIDGHSELFPLKETVQCNDEDGNVASDMPAIDWVIAGGESGPAARPSHPDWYTSLRDQCAAAGVPFLFKQWGEWLPISQQNEAFTNRLYRSNRVAKLHEDQGVLDDCYGRRCTVDATVIHMDGSTHGISEPMAFLQGTSPMTTFRVGKKAAGRLLDDAELSAFPA